METLTIEILDPSAKQVLLNLESSRQINIQAKKKQALENLLRAFKNDDIKPSYEEITEIVEEVREERYQKELNENNS